jgi:ABC-type cobalt transport system substrate-binding protein
MSVGDKTTRNLAYAITIGFFSVLFTLMFADVSKASENVLYMMLGALGSAWAGVIAYYFGSTAGSKQKTELLARSAPVVDEGVVPPNPYAR